MYDDATPSERSSSMARGSNRAGRLPAATMAPAAFSVSRTARTLPSSNVLPASGAGTQARNRAPFQVIGTSLPPPNPALSVAINEVYLYNLR